MSGDVPELDELAEFWHVVGATGLSRSAVERFVRARRLPQRPWATPRSEPEQTTDTDDQVRPAPAEPAEAEAVALAPDQPPAVDAVPDEWPPPVRPDDRREDLVVSAVTPLEEVVHLRVVEYRGREVLVDELGRILCHCCRRLLTVDQADAHPVGRPPAAGSPPLHDRAAVRALAEQLHADGHSVQQICTAVGCVETLVHQIRAERDRYAAPPPRPSPSGSGWLRW